MKNKHLIIILAAIGLIIATFASWSLYKIALNEFIENRIVVEVKDGLDSNKIEITNEAGKILFDNGKERNNVEKVYGRYIFKIFYGGKYVDDINTFRFNNHAAEEYVFSLSKPRDEIIAAMFFYHRDPEERLNLGI